jgi:hypothetical protein
MQVGSITLPSVNHYLPCFFRPLQTLTLFFFSPFQALARHIHESRGVGGGSYAASPPRLLVTVAR